MNNSNINLNKVVKMKIRKFQICEKNLFFLKHAKPECCSITTYLALSQLLFSGYAGFGGSNWGPQPNTLSLSNTRVTRWLKKISPNLWKCSQNSGQNVINPIENPNLLVAFFSWSLFMTFWCDASCYFGFNLILIGLKIFL